MSQDLAEYLDFPAQDVPEESGKMMVDFAIRRSGTGINKKEYMTKEEIYAEENKLVRDPAVEYFVVSYCGTTDVYRR